jgi:hypothetical protein
MSALPLNADLFPRRKNVGSEPEADTVNGALHVRQWPILDLVMTFESTPFFPDAENISKILKAWRRESLSMRVSLWRVVD